LVRLDGRDDVAHPSGAFAAQRGEEGALPGDGLQTERFGRIEVEQFVVEVAQLPASGDEGATPRDARWMRCRRAVERRGRARSPVDEHHLAVLVDHRDPADVEVLAVREVEPTE